jgi:hypothetical protein
MTVGGSVPPAPKVPIEPGLVASMLAKLVDWLKASNSRSPLDELHRERHDSLAMTRKSILERAKSARIGEGSTA